MRIFFLFYMSMSQTLFLLIIYLSYFCIVFLISSVYIFMSNYYIDTFYFTLVINIKCIFTLFCFILGGN